MTVNRDQADLLASLAVAIRAEARSSRWDKSGIVAAIGRVKDRSLADVATAVVTAADAADLDNPGAIGNPRALCWEKRRTDRLTIDPYDPTTACDVCSLPEHRHTDLSGHEFISAHDAARRRDTGPKPPLPRRHDTEETSA